jgi:hypothetical protein
LRAFVSTFGVRADLYDYVVVVAFFKKKLFFLFPKGDFVRSRGGGDATACGAATYKSVLTGLLVAGGPGRELIAVRAGHRFLHL